MSGLSAEELINHINKKFGANTLMRAADAAGLEKVRCPFGIAGIDIMLNGGLVEGKIHQLRGNESSSKSTHALKFALSYLKKHPNGVFVLVDAEDSNDVEFLKILGFTDDELARTYYFHPGSGERAGDVACEVAEKAEKVVIVIDSVDALTPTAEIDNDMEKVGVSPGARMMNKFMRKIVPVMQAGLSADTPRCTVVMICQTREKIGVMFGSNITTWGGKGKNFAAATIIDLARSGYLREGTGKTRLTFAMDVTATLYKCKGPAQGDSAEYTFYKAAKNGYRNGDFDDASALFAWAVRLEIVKKKANTYQYNALSAMKAKFIDELRNDIHLFNRLLKEVTAARQDLYGVLETPAPPPKIAKKGLTRRG